jgi:hypothetical protein
MAADTVGTIKLKPVNYMVDSLTLLFNFVFDNETWPERWATGIVFPLYNRTHGSIQPTTDPSPCSRSLSGIVECRLSTWSEAHESLADEQRGFRRNRGTADLVFMLREIVMTRKIRG